LTVQGMQMDRRCEFIDGRGEERPHSRPRVPNSTVSKLEVQQREFAVKRTTGGGF
jgi:hypothetical protein